MIDPEVSLPLRLLRLLSGGGIRSTSELARTLGISEGLVTMMAEDLTAPGIPGGVERRRGVQHGLRRMRAGGRVLGPRRATTACPC